MARAREFYSYDLLTRTKTPAGERVRVDDGDGGYIEFTVRDGFVEILHGNNRKVMVIKPYSGNVIQLMVIKDTSRGS